MKPRSRRPGAVKVAVALLLVASCMAAAPWIAGQRSQAARRHWKNAAIPAISCWAEDTHWRTKEIEGLAGATNNPPVLGQGWLTDKLILMENGEWLVYKSHCSKEAPHHVKDIFLAKGSDGNWYYSTFHFCVGLCALLGEQETQPHNLAEFAYEYNLSRFDGRSDDCLRETRTFPASWYEKMNTKRGGRP